MHVICPTALFAVRWLHVVVIICTVALGICVSSGSQTKVFFFFFSGLAKYLASVFMVLRWSKAPFNSLFYGYAYSKQIVIFYNNL